MISRSLALALPFLGKTVAVTMDRPMGSKHPSGKFEFEVNYGYVAGAKAQDGDELDAYFLGIAVPVLAAAGRCIAVVHRIDDDDDQLVVVPEGVQLTNSEIMDAIHFQEQYFNSTIVRG